MWVGGCIEVWGDVYVVVVESYGFVVVYFFGDCFVVSLVIVLVFKVDDCVVVGFE